MWSNDGMLYCDLCGNAIRWREGEHFNTDLIKARNGNKEEFQYCDKCWALNQVKGILNRGRG